jgi:hypothetical protein
MHRVLVLLSTIALVCLVAAPAVAAKPNLVFHTKVTSTTGDVTVTLPGNSQSWMTLRTGGQAGPASWHTLGLTQTKANPGLEGDEYPFYLVSSTADLADYFADKVGWPDDFRDQIAAEIAGDAPFFILTYDGTTYGLVDGFHRGLSPIGGWTGYDYGFTGFEPLVIDDDYPVGRYVYEGTLVGTNDAELLVTITLRVVRS